MPYAGMILQAFNAISALVGGVGLMGDPTGSALEMKISWLEGTPFPDFLIPGIFLFVVNELGNLAGFILTFRRYHYAGQIAASFGIILMIWIVLQVLGIGYQSFLPPLYFTTGMIQMILGWYLMRKTIRTREVAV